MHIFQIADVYDRLRRIGMLDEAETDRGALSWRVHQSRRLGLMYTPERVERLFTRGEIPACFLFKGEEEVARPGGGVFVPEPFPVPAKVYEHISERRRRDRVGFLSELAYHKLAYERGRGDIEFESADEYGLYCALIERCYANDWPFRARYVYWILFSERGVEFFAEQSETPLDLLERFHIERAPQ